MTDAEQAEMDALQKRLDEAEAAKATADERSENAQKKIHEWEAEVGETRKEQSDNAKLLKQYVLEKDKADKERQEAQDNLGKVNTELADLKKKGPTEEPQNTRKTVQEKIEDIEQTLTDEDRDAMDKALEKADDKLKESINGDDKAYLMFLEQLRASNPEPSVPRWRNTPAKTPADSGDAEAKRVKALFENAKQNASFIPDGPDGGTPKMQTKHDRLPTAKPQADWVHAG